VLVIFRASPRLVILFVCCRRRLVLVASTVGFPLHDACYRANEAFRLSPLWRMTGVESIRKFPQQLGRTFVSCGGGRCSLLQARIRASRVITPGFPVLWSHTQNDIFGGDSHFCVSAKVKRLRFRALASGLSTLVCLSCCRMRRKWSKSVRWLRLLPNLSDLFSRRWCLTTPRD
jgi:hypothetical protein